MRVYGSETAASTAVQTSPSSRTERLALTEVPLLAGMMPALATQHDLVSADCHASAASAPRARCSRLTADWISWAVLVQA